MRTITEYTMLNKRMADKTDGEGYNFCGFLVTKNLVGGETIFRITEKRRVTIIRENEVLNPNKVPASEDELYKIGYIVRLMDEMIRDNIKEDANV